MAAKYPKGSTLDQTSLRALRTHHVVSPAAEVRSAAKLWHGPADKAAYRSAWKDCHSSGFRVVSRTRELVQLGASTPSRAYISHPTNVLVVVRAIACLQSDQIQLVLILLPASRLAHAARRKDGILEGKKKLTRFTYENSGNRHAFAEP